MDHQLERECENIKNIGKTTYAGMTFTCIKIEDRFETSWIGDSTAKIIAYGKGEEPKVLYFMENKDQMLGIKKILSL